MAPREDLVSSAITFLQDPSVASSPVEKRIEFLRSKNLTLEEINVAIARAADDTYQSGPVQSQGDYSSQHAPAVNYNRGPPQQQQQQQRYPPFAGSQYGGYGEWAAAPPPEVPKRDWRDWFIMATVTGGAAYGLYVLTKRYIAPLISPPTPPQLESDKSAIDAEFIRAFTLIETLSADTATLKSAEESRTERLDRALEEVESVVSELKAAAKRREDEVRRVNEELRGLKEGIPKALEGHRESSDKRLGELGNELRSLKALMGNRFGSSSGGGQSQTQPQLQSSQSSQPQSHPLNPSVTDITSSSNSTPKPYPFSPTSSTPNLPTTSSSATISSASGPGGAVSSATPVPSQQGKAAIPAWQMAASRKGAGTPSGTGSAGAGA